MYSLGDQFISIEDFKEPERIRELINKCNNIYLIVDYEPKYVLVPIEETKETKVRYVAEGKEEKKIGKYIKETLFDLIEKELIPFEEVERLEEEKYSKKALNSNYPVLKEISNDASEEEIDKAKRDERGYGRYYKTPIKAYGRTYLLVSQWVENQHRKYFSKWIENLKK
ncbi:hypothetical protein [Clostridium paraputrificum]|uniref:hypothetical protein n=1 Tax=Clostridium paraputrificum TaxID=29363 RepID=UPI00040A0F33|nr:hypothetical protein [Clostridium paraputrificum]